VIERGKKIAASVIDEQRCCRRKREIVQQLLELGLGVPKIDGDIAGELAFDEPRDKFGFADDGFFALIDKAVAERVQKQHTADQNQNRQKIKRDDLPRKRRPVHGNDATPVPLSASFAFSRSVCADPVFAQNDFCLPGAFHLDPRRGHLLFVVTISDAVQRLNR